MGIIKMEAYAGYYSDENRLIKSSSGGAATAIAEAITDRGGIAYGAVYSQDFHSALYGYAEEKDDLWKFRGSKYTYVNKYVIRDGKQRAVYQDVISELNKGRIVLFTGLGCDLAYLKQMTDKESVDTDRLFMMELLCDGVTNEIVHDEYISEIEKIYGARVRAFSVRHKDEGWVPPYIYAEFENGKEHRQLFHSTDYGFAFLNYKKKACYECPFKGENHFGDIMAADFWGCAPGMKEYNPNGVSLILVQSGKGEVLLKYLDQEQFFLRRIDAQYALNCNPRYFTPHERYHKWNLFDSIIKKKGLREAVKACAAVSVPERFRNYKDGRLALWGTGKCFRQNITLLKEMYPIISIVDSDESKWGKEVEPGFICEPPDVLRGKSNLFVLIMIGNVNAAFQVANKLLDMGVTGFDHINNWIYYAY